MIRLKNIQCWKCKQLFDFSTEIPSEHVFSVYCRVCDAENVIDLNPYKNREEEFYRMGTQTGATQRVETGDYNFPNKISGKKQKE